MALRLEGHHLTDLQQKKHGGDINVWKWKNPKLFCFVFAFFKEVIQKKLGL